MQSEDDLTPQQWLWLQSQMLLDAGLVACPTCDEPGEGVFCTNCGARLKTEPLRCSHCQRVGSGRYCAQCGGALGQSLADTIKAGTFDWQAWETSLTPFLGSLTPREQALMARG